MATQAKGTVEKKPLEKRVEELEKKLHESEVLMEKFYGVKNILDRMAAIENSVVSLKAEVASSVERGHALDQRVRKYRAELKNADKS